MTEKKNFFLEIHSSRFESHIMTIGRQIILHNYKYILLHKFTFSMQDKKSDNANAVLIDFTFPIQNGKCIYQMNPRQMMIYVKISKLVRDYFLQDATITPLCTPSSSVILSD